jgi:hypothetical protein
MRAFVRTHTDHTEIQQIVLCHATVMQMKFAVDHGRIRFIQLPVVIFLI